MPAPDLGKAITSRIDDVSHTIAMNRSKPSARPAWGGAPLARARSRGSNRAVAHEIIVLPVNRRQQRIALRRVLTGQGLVQPRHIVGQRRRERMVRGTPAAMRHLRLVIVCARK